LLNNTHSISTSAYQKPWSCISTAPLDHYMTPFWLSWTHLEPLRCPFGMGIFVVLGARISSLTSISCSTIHNTASVQALTRNPQTMCWEYLDRVESTYQKP
jgi:hypothetical protein